MGDNVCMCIWVVLFSKMVVLDWPKIGVIAGIVTAFIILIIIIKIEADKLARSQ